MADPTYHDVARILKADFDAGKLYWLPRTPEFFRTTPGKTAKSACANWNSRFANTEACSTVNDKGYKCGRVIFKKQYAHRVLWLLHTGEWPRKQIDHINGNPLDNRIENLRVVSCAENMKNKRIGKNNTSGVQGVAWYEPSNKWAAYIRVKGRKQFLGYFLDITDATEARKRAEAKYGYHPNHGRS